MRFAFTKMHGTGNDFVLVDARGLEVDWAALAPRLCDRHFGVGADGLLLALPSAVAPVRMRMFNPDGSEGEMCGNGLRCFVKWAVERGLVEAPDGTLAVETGAGVLTATFPRSAAGAIGWVRLSMGRPRLAPVEIPVATPGPGPVSDFVVHVDGAGYPVTCVSMGNPHAVHFTETPVDALPLDRIGPLVEHAPAFPQRVNLEIVNVLGPDHLRMRVWERGAGLTLACGTGAAAVMVAARLRGAVGRRATISLPGGDLVLEWDGEGPVYLEGPAAEVFTGEWTANGDS